MTGFATVDDVATTLRRVFNSWEEEWVKSLLAQAAGHLRSIIGQHVYPPRTLTYTDYPVSGRVNLPQSHIQTIDSVTADGIPVPFTRFEDSLTGISAREVEVTFTHGAVEAPEDLKGINIAMVSSAITLAENDLGLNVGGLSSIALDDFKIAFADGGAHSGHMTLPEHTQNIIRAAHGASAGTVETP